MQNRHHSVCVGGGGECVVVECKVCSSSMMSCMKCIHRSGAHKCTGNLSFSDVDEAKKRCGAPRVTFSGVFGSSSFLLTVVQMVVLPLCSLASHSNRDKTYNLPFCFDSTLKGDAANVVYSKKSQLFRLLFLCCFRCNDFVVCRLTQRCFPVVAT